MYSASTASTVCYSVVQSQFQELNWGSKLWLVRDQCCTVYCSGLHTRFDFVIVIYAKENTSQQLQTDPVSESVLVLSVTVDKYRNLVIKCHIPLSELFMAFLVHYKKQYHRYFQPAFLLCFIYPMWHSSCKTVVVPCLSLGHKHLFILKILKLSEFPVLSNFRASATNLSF